MIDQNGFEELVREIQRQGYDSATAAQYAALIGDTPLFDRDGSILVMDGRRLVARLKPLKFFQSKES